MADEKNDYGGVLDFLGGLVDTGITVWQNQEQRDWASQEAQHNRDFQQRMYERQLDDSIAWRTHQEQYNSPEAMMQRYRDAGINPMYAVSGGSVGNTIATPFSVGGGSHGSSTPTPNQHRLSFAEAFRMRNEARMTDAHVELLESEAREHNVISEGIELDNAKKNIESGYWASNAYQTSRNLIKMNQLNDAQRSLLEKQGAEIDAHMDEIQSKINLNKAAVADHLAHVQHQVWYTSFMQSLAPLERERLQYAVDELRSTANIKQFQDEMKKTSYWLNFGTQIVGSISQVIGSIKGLSFAPLNSVNNSYSESYSTVDKL